MKLANLNCWLVFVASSILKCYPVLKEFKTRTKKGTQIALRLTAVDHKILISKRQSKHNWFKSK